MLDLAKSLLRLVMLVFKLRISLFGFYLNPIFYAICGLIQTVTAIFIQVSKQGHEASHTLEITRELEELHLINEEL